MKNLCIKCPNSLRGKCCYYSYQAFSEKGSVYNLILENHPCPFLDTNKGVCLIYKIRFKENPYCEPAKEGVIKGAMIDGCKYLDEWADLIEVPPKIDEIPNDTRSIDKKMIAYLNTMPQKRFLELFYPKLYNNLYKSKT